MNRRITLGKIFAAIVVIMAAVLAIVVYMIDDSGEKYVATHSDVVAAFSGDEFYSTYSTTEITAVYGSTYLGDEEKAELLGEVAKELSITKYCPYESVRNNDIITGQIKAGNEGSEVSIEFISKENDEGNNVIYLEQYIKVRICIENSVESTLYYRDKLIEFFKSMNMKTTSAISVCGEISRILDDKEKEEVGKRFFGELYAGVVSKDIKDRYYAVYGYTDGFDEYVIYGDKKVNLTLIIEEDEDNKVTSVYMATPTI